ncbi:MAG: hypothetical protein ABJB11_14580 [Ferruginibacter sp.]
MKLLKSLSVVVIVTGLVFSFTSCKKDKPVDHTITKDQLTGKWNMLVQSSNGPLVWHAELKNSGALEVDTAPYDGKPDFILLWDISNNNFTAHLDANGITNYWLLNAPVSTTAMAGQLKTNATPSEVLIFTMDKQ